MSVDYEKYSVVQGWLSGPMRLSISAELADLLYDVLVCHGEIEPGSADD